MKNSFVDKVVEDIKKLSNDALKSRLLEALDESLDIHTGKSKPEKNCKSPREISKRYQIDLSQLEEYRVILDYKEAVNFLENQGFKIKMRKRAKDKYKSFRSTYHSGRFKKVFDRKPDKSENNVYTYAEVMYLVNQPEKIKI